MVVEKFVGIGIRLAISAWAVLISTAAMADSTAVQDSVKASGAKNMRLTLTSTAFRHFESIPSEYTCNGVGISPPLNWSVMPDTVKSFALICDDPDAPLGTWDHWVIYNIPAAVHSLKANMPRDTLLADGTRNGYNSWGRAGYGGPCPPDGSHRYFFKLYALDTLLSFKEKVKAQQLMEAMKGHIVARSELMGRYTK